MKFNLRYILLTTTAGLMSVVSFGQEIKQQQKDNAAPKIENVQNNVQNSVQNNGTKIEKRVTQEGDCIVTELVQKKTPQQLYTERWAKWQKDNNATKAELLAAQAEENRKWAEFKAKKPEKASQAIQQQVDGSEKILDKTIDCPEGVDCEEPILGTAIPEVIKKFTVIADCPECEEPKQQQDSIAPEYKKWRVYGGYGREWDMSKSNDMHTHMSDRGHRDYLHVTAVLPSLGTDGAAKYIHPLLHARHYFNNSVQGVLLGQEQDFEYSFANGNLHHKTSGTTVLAAGLRAEKQFILSNDGRFSMNPSVDVALTKTFGGGSRFESTENNPDLGLVPFTKHFKQPDWNGEVKANLGFEYNIGKNGKEDKGWFVTAIAGMRFLQTTTVTDAIAYEAGTADEYGINSTNSGFFKNATGYVEVGIGYKFKTETRASKQKRLSLKEQQEQEAAKLRDELNTLEQENLEQENDSIPLNVEGKWQRIDENGNVIELEILSKENLKVEEVKAEEPAPEINDSQEEDKLDQDQGTIKQFDENFDVVKFFSNPANRLRF